MLLKSLKAFLSHLSPQGNEPRSDVDSSPSLVYLTVELSLHFSVSLNHSLPHTINVDGMECLIYDAWLQLAFHKTMLI